MTFSLSHSKWSTFTLLPLLALACSEGGIESLEADGELRGKQQGELVEVGPAVHDDGIFELDRNALDEVADGDDWNTVLLGNGGSAIANTGVIAEDQEGTVFTSGNSKDDLNVSQWRWKKSSVILDKNNITNAYAAAYSVVRDGVPHLVLYFGLDRFSNDGSAQVGFWFFKDEISLNQNGTFSGTHTDGDILVQSNFSQGGTVDKVSVFQWSNGALEPLTNGGDCDTAPMNEAVCGVVNKVSTMAPWSYTPKPNIGPAGFFPQGTFFEGGIDLTALQLTDTCFSTFLAETRSSTPFDAVLKDFVGPQAFDTCNIEVTKTCSNPRLNADGTKIIYDISGSVNTGGFDLFDVDLVDSPPADGLFQRVNCEDPNIALGNFPLDTLKGEACYKNTISVNLDQNGTSDTVTVTASTKPDQQGTPLSAQATATCPNFQISPALTVTKQCDTSIAVVDSKVAVQVNVKGQVCNAGDSRIDAVEVVDLNFDTTPDPLLSGVTLQPGACASYSGSYLPPEANDAAGEPTTCISEVVFKDTVQASALDILGNPVDPAMAEAVCPLCPGGECPP